MITAQFGGGLGNQLFQVAAALGLARANGDVAAFNFNNWRCSTQGHSPKSYRSGIFRHLFETNRMYWEIHRDFGVTYRAIPYQRNLQLRGLFQSPKYFEDCRDLLLTVFAPPQSLLIKLHSKYRQILNQPNCAIHIRRGDYCSSSSYCRPLDLEYYRQAIDLFPDSHFLVFSDDMDYCSQIFTSPQFSFAEGNSDEEDLYLMSLCQHQIIANSTFSWWAAYLNQNPDKRIIAPRSWSTRRNTTEQNDIYTQSMEII